MSVVETESNGPAETLALAKQVAGLLAPGDVVLLEGDLGAGKTVFARGVAEALGVAEPVTSPTFVVARAYEARLPVAHLDLYRVPEPDEETHGIVLDAVSQGGVALVEWPWPELAARLTVRLAHGGRDRRLVAFETHDPSLADALRQLVADARTRHLDTASEPRTGGSDGDDR